MASRKNIDMTQGVIWKQQLSFAFPLLIGYMFQQLYNTVDSIVVGNFVGKEALAAVGTTGNIINAIVGFFLGLSIGAGVVVSQYFGAKDTKNLHDTIHTTMLLTFVTSIIATAAGVLLVPTMLRLTKTPDDVFELSNTYLTIYFSGLLGLMIYNMGSGILRAVGDTKRPLYFLIFSAIVNTGLDILFVAVFHMGVAGVALATVIAQALSAVLVLVVLSRTEEAYRLIWHHLHMHPHIMKQILRVGVPSGIQNAIVSFSNVFVQAYINAFGSACMAGYSSYAKLDQFILLPMQAISMASTTFVGQNIGAGNIKRAKQGTRTALSMSLICTAVLIVPMLLFAPTAVSLFNQDSEVIRYGASFMRMISPFYLCCCINQVLAGAVRGAGDAKAPMYIMLSSFVVFRQIYLYFGTKLIDSAVFVCMGYPAGWVLCSALMIWYYRRGKWENKRRLIVDTQTA